MPNLDNPSSSKTNSPKKNHQLIIFFVGITLIGVAFYALKKKK
jgi:LPXTG-motif cell wall-anchored protein